MIKNRFIGYKNGANMGRPQIYLKDWCLEDSLLKAEFLKNESENPIGLVIKDPQQGYIPNFNNYPQFKTGIFNLGMLRNGTQVRITQSCYEKLKAKFRTFKKKDKDKDKVKKQYYLDRKTANFLSKFKEKNHFDREEIVIEYLVSNKQNQELQNEHFKKIDQSTIRVQNLKNELENNKNLCAQALKDTQNLRIRIDALDDLLARAYILNDFFKETLQKNGVNFNRPIIDDETVEKYKFEIRNNLRTYLD